MSQLQFFLGPCVLESKDLAVEVIEFLQKNLPPRTDWFFKASFDKANRTSIKSYRGPGLEKGLAIFEELKKSHGVRVLTDYHYPEQADAVASVCDVLQVPAFLSRQTDMILAGAEACAKYDSILKVKKGQFLAPTDMKNVVEKAREFLPLEKIYLTERGSSFGYGQLIVDMGSYSLMKQTGAKVVHDATHCVQRPGGLGDSTGGNRALIAPIARAAVAAGAQGVFMEVHPRPDEALSDKATVYPLDKAPLLIKQLQDIAALEINDDT